jgi:SAM-dependent methyltransferase
MAFAGTCDVIILHQVLEHIERDEIIPTLENLFSLLKPGGFMSVAVPNASSILGGFSFAIDFTHLISFSEYSLRQVLELASFERVEIVQHPPKLFFSARKPQRSALRALNRVRYSLNQLLHLGLYVLRDQHPFPKCFEETLEMLAYRPAH